MRWIEKTREGVEQAVHPYVRVDEVREWVEALTDEERDLLRALLLKNGRGYKEWIQAVADVSRGTKLEKMRFFEKLQEKKIVVSVRWRKNEPALTIPDPVFSFLCSSLIAPSYQTVCAQNISILEPVCYGLQPFLIEERRKLVTPPVIEQEWTRFIKAVKHTAEPFFAAGDEDLSSYQKQVRWAWLLRSRFDEWFYQVQLNYLSTDEALRSNELLERLLVMQQGRAVSYEEMLNLVKGCSSWENKFKTLIDLGVWVLDEEERWLTSFHSLLYQENILEIDFTKFLIQPFMPLEKLFSVLCWGEVVDLDVYWTVEFEAERFQNEKPLFPHFDGLVKTLEPYMIDRDKTVMTWRRWLHSSHSVKKDPDTWLNYQFRDQGQAELVINQCEDREQVIQVDNKVFVRTVYQPQFEKQLKKVGYNLEDGQETEAYHGDDNEHDEVVTVTFPIFPEREDVKRLPLQWFHLLPYEEGMLGKLLKQARSWRLPIRVQMHGQVHIMDVVTVERRAYPPYFQNHKQEKVLFCDIEKLSLVNPYEPAEGLLDGSSFD
ncbi:hypothetical protein [Texcoconibacillus texcoconensis]|uniref:Uncharacterized protein n=1 Tax=Texcoconibacillus texcoconensis TaxID=1095777 RepID=A0A840QLH7_9BACI|nr:hypothetical protein [Texcoconibacillus texcoconensis]MBB5172200.1 hypothetical protein [Texcoconibacillus texcoconensis]